MTDRLTALRELLAKVEAGALHLEPHGGMPSFTAMYRHFEDGRSRWSDRLAMDAYWGSFDAMKSLDMALPTPSVAMSDEDAKIILFGRNGARHWLAWKFRALIAQEEGR